MTHNCTQDISAAINRLMAKSQSRSNEYHRLGLKTEEEHEKHYRDGLASALLVVQPHMEDGNNAIIR